MKFYLFVYQFEIWKFVREINSIWFFDATGNIHRDINKQKKPFYYSLVCHDTNLKSIVPVAEFLTTANDQVTIGKYLSDIRLIFEKNSSKNMLPSIIVTDNGWALMNSVLSSFNDCDMKQYINWCYCFVHGRPEVRQYKIILYLCSTHFLKNMIKKAKQVTIANHVRRAFLFMFALLQNSITIEQINLYLKKIHAILYTEILNGKNLRKNPI